MALMAEWWIHGCLNSPLKGARNGRCGAPSTHHCVGHEVERPAQIKTLRQRHRRPGFRERARHTCARSPFLLPTELLAIEPDPWRFKHQSDTAIATRTSLRGQIAQSSAKLFVAMPVYFIAQHMSRRSLFPAAEFAVDLTGKSRSCTLPRRIGILEASIASHIGRRLVAALGVAHKIKERDSARSSIYPN